MIVILAYSIRVATRPGKVKETTEGLLVVGEDPVAADWGADPSSSVPAVPAETPVPAATFTAVEASNNREDARGDSAVPSSPPEITKGVTTSEADSMGLSNKCNVIIFNACRKPSAAKELKALMLKKNPSLKISTPTSWVASWQMQITRIYFCQNEYYEDALALGKYLPGDQEVIDYVAQMKKGIWHKLEGKYSRMHDFRPERNIAIFLGSDFEPILEHMQPREEKTNEQN